jgi:hypothetical protein
MLNPSAAGKGLDDIDRAIGGNCVREPGAVEDGFAVDKDGHVFAQGALIIEDVAAGGRVRGEVGIQRSANGRAVDHGGWAGDVALNVLSKANVRHGRWFHFLCVPEERSSSREPGNKPKAVWMARHWKRHLTVQRTGAGVEDIVCTARG